MLIYNEVMTFSTDQVSYFKITPIYQSDNFGLLVVFVGGKQETIYENPDLYIVKSQLSEMSKAWLDEALGYTLPPAEVR